MGQPDGPKGTRKCSSMTSMTSGSFPPPADRPGALLPDGKKDGVTNAARFVYALPEGATARDLASARPRDVWYVGGVTDENARQVSVKLDFLTPGLTYEAVIYADAADADYETNPQAYTITRRQVRASDVLDIWMARSGGFAVSLREM